MSENEVPGKVHMCRVRVQRTEETRKQPITGKDYTKQKRYQKTCNTKKEGGMKGWKSLRDDRQTGKRMWRVGSD